MSVDRYQNSKLEYQRALKVLPSGVSRVTISRDPCLIYISRGKGSWLFDVDGNRYLDMNNNFTTLIHGHAFPPVVQAVTRRLQDGSCYANPTLEEIELAEIICSRIPTVDKIRFVNTGSEAVMFTIKAARAYTGRHKIAKFEGAYHGNYDWAEVSEQSNTETWGDIRKPVSVRNYEGSPPSVLEDTISLPFNFYDETLALLEQHANELACVLIDLMPSRAGLIPVNADYLKMLREFTRKHNILLISDEVLNFRQSSAGAAALFNVEPDLIALGKIIGGGFPIGAIAGSETFMSVFNSGNGRPKVSQGGTFSANPMSMVAGIESMKALDGNAFEHLEKLGNYMREKLACVFQKHGTPMSVSGQASLFRIHPKIHCPSSYRDVLPTPVEKELLLDMCRSLINQGIILPNHGTGALSSVMTESEVDFFVDAVEQFVRDY